MESAQTTSTVLVKANNEDFFSVRDFAWRFGLARKEAKACLEKGLSGDEILQKLSPVRHVIYAKSERFESVRKFALRFGLPYQSVLAAIKKGMTGDQMLAEVAPVSQSNLNAGANSKYGTCIVEGVEYPSISRAADAHHISPSQVYAYRTKHNVSAEEAFAKILEKRGTTSRSGEHKQPCTINGVKYPSATAAINDFGLAASTVYSRMQREGITLEEALLRGKKEHRRIAPTHSSFMRTILQEVSTEEVIACEAGIRTLLDSLTYYQYEFDCLRDVKKEHFAVRTHDNFNPNEAPIEIFIIYSAKTQLVELFIPQLIRCGKNISKQDLLLTINTVNAEYLNIKLFYNSVSNTVSANWAQPVKKESVAAKHLLSTFFSMLGAAEEILSDIKAYAEK